MADETKKVLIDIEVSNRINTSIDKIVELKKDIQELKNSEKELKEALEQGEISRDEYNRTLVTNEASLKALKSQLNDHLRIMQNQYKQTDLNNDSMNAMATELSKLKGVYRSLTQEERNSDFGKAIQKNAKELNDKLLELEKSYGQFSRQVGNYEIAGNSLKAELKELTNQLTEMALAGQKDSEAYQELVEKAAALRDAVADVTADINHRASDTRGLDALSQSLQGIMSAVATYNSVIGLAGKNDEEFVKILQKVQIAVGALTALTTIQSLAQKQSIAYTYAKVVADKLLINSTNVQTASIGANTLAEKLNNAMKMKGTIITKAITVAQLLWNAAITANPIMLLVTGVLALIVGLTKLFKAFDDSAKAEKKAEQAEKDYAKTREEVTATIERNEQRKQKVLNDTDIALRKRILEIKKSGKTEKEISKEVADATYQAEQKKRDIIIKNTTALLQQYSIQAKELQKAATAQLNYINTLKKGSNKYEEAVKKLQDYNKQIRDLNKNILEGNNTINSTILEKQEAEQQRAEEQKQKAKEQTAKAREKAYNQELKTLETRKKLQEKQNEINKLSISDNLVEQQAYEQKVFDEQQKYSQEKLALQRKYRKITETEAKQENAILEAEQTSFFEKQQKELENALKKEITSIQNSEDEQVSRLKESNQKKIQNYTQMVEQMYGEQKASQKSADMIAKYTLAIYSKEQNEIERIHKESIATRVKDLETSLEKEYGNDIKKFSDNELEKTKIEIQETKRRIEEKKKIDGADTIDDENKLRELESKQRQLQLNLDLMTTLSTEQAKFNAKKTYLEQELEIHKDNATKRAEIEKELKDLTLSYEQEKISAFESYIAKIGEFANSIHTIISNNENAELQNYEEKNDRQKEALEERLNSGLISQEEYDNQVAILDKNLDKKKADLTIKQAKREKALKLFEIATNTATAIMKIWAEVPKFDFGVSTTALTAVAATLGALQATAVMNEPLPKAAKGKLIRGKSHAQGGETIEAEAGEVIINKKSAKMFLPLLSAINQAGGGISFGAGLPRNVGSINDGGFSVRHSSDKTATSQDIKELQKAINDMRVYVAVEDINRGQRKYADVGQTAMY